MSGKTKEILRDLTLLAEKVNVIKECEEKKEQNQPKIGGGKTQIQQTMNRKAAYMRAFV